MIDVPFAQFPKLILANVRSINNKSDFFYSVCSSHNIQLAIITETWIKDVSSHAHFNWKGFNFFSANRSNKRGGGVAIWCRQNFHCASFAYNKPESLSLIDILPVKLSLSFIDILLVALYIPPSENNNSEIEVHIIDFIEDIKEQCNFSGIILCGDFNRVSTMLIEGELDISNIVHDATRGDSTLDKIFISPSLTKFIKGVHCIDPIASSDHNAIIVDPLITNSMSKPNSKSPYTSVYDFRMSNLSLSETFFSSINWSLQFETQSISDTVDIFYSLISSALSYIPFKRIKRTEKDKSWMTNTIKLMINERYKAYYQKNFSKYECIQKRIRAEIEKAKANYISDLRKRGNIWKAVAEIEGRKNTNKFSSKDINDITNSLSNIYKENEAQSISPLPKAELSNMSSIKEIVHTNIAKFNIKKAIGTDKIPNKFIHAFAHHLKEPLSIITTNIILSCSFPNSLKEGIVVPIPKAGKLSSSNFRPITILNGFSRIIEKSIFQFYETEFNNSYGANQFGFRKGSSTTLALLYCIEHIRRILKDPFHTGCLLIAIDLSKAFDCVNHNKLVKKLQNKCSTNLAALIQSYLLNRSASVVIDGLQGSSFPLERGVPQGSCLGPALFNIYVSDLDVCHPGTILIKYADDITLLIPLTTKNADNVISDELENVGRWCEANSMKVNNKKTQIMPIMKKGHSYLSGKYATVDSFKLLGVTIDKRLNFLQHFKRVCATACKNIFIIKKLTKICNKDELNCIFLSKVCSIIEYSLPIIPKISSEALQLIHRIYKRCHSIINFSSNVPSRNIQKIRDNLHLRLFKRVLRSPSLFWEFIPKTSHTGRFLLSQISTQRDLLSFFIKGAQLYNLKLKR